MGVSLYSYGLYRNSNFSVMRKKSWLSEVVRILSLCVIISLVGMCYWSSLIQEEKLQKLSRSIHLLEEKVKNIPSQIQKERILPKTTSSGAHFLETDPYYEKTLPQQLGPSFTPHGTLRLAQIGKADNLHPFSEWAHVSEWIGYAQRGIMGLQFGSYQRFCPDIALSVDEDDAPDRPQAFFTIHLREDVFWEPLESAHFPPEVHLADHFLQRHPVTAHDFVFFFQAVKNPYVDVPTAVTLRQLLENIESVVAIDDHTLRITYTKTKVEKDRYELPVVAKIRIAMIRPLARSVYQYAVDGSKLCVHDESPGFYAKSSVWAQQFAHHFSIRVIPSCGAYIFDGATDRMIRFRRNPNFYDSYQALYDAVEVLLVDSPDSMWRHFMEQKIDVCVVPPGNLRELERFQKSPFCMSQKEKGHEVKTLEYLARSFSYLALNMQRSCFESKKVRQAFSMAVDYRRLIHQILYDQAEAITGPFFKESKAYNAAIHEWQYDPEAAKRLLAEDGWYDADGDGIVEKERDGKRVPFRFSLLFYVKNPITKAYCEMLSTYFKEIGVGCHLKGVDFADLSAAVEDKNFDALFLAWQLAPPPEDPDQLWHSNGALKKGSSNLVGFADERVDHAIERLRFEKEEEKRLQLYHEVHAILHEDAPYLYLYSPKTTLAYWSWIENLMIPKEHPELIPGADVVEPSVLVTWKKRE